MFKIEWSYKAYKQLEKIQKLDRKTITNAVKTLIDFPNCKNIRALTNHQYPYRLRVGRYRVFFTIGHAVKIAKIEEVKKRDEQTY